jgi:uncharacterized repeat protein (TIGR01451 family)
METCTRWSPNSSFALISRFFITVIAFLGCAIGSELAAQVKGRVFKDFDASGSYTATNPDEVGAPNVKVRAFVNQNPAPLETTTNLAGYYEFGSIAAGSMVRIEFASWEAGAASGAHGSQNQSSIRFVTAPASDVDFGINHPADFCEIDPKITIPCYVNGDPQKGGNAGGEIGLVQFDNKATGLSSPTNFPGKKMASTKDVGTVWGLAYHRRGGNILSATFLKRHSGYGTLGMGGIYRTDPDSSKTYPFVDVVNDLGIDLGPDPRAIVNDLSDDFGQASRDSLAMGAVGKVGMGSIDLADSDETLYMVNLYDKKLYKIFVDVPLVKPTKKDVKSYQIPNPCAVQNDYRPWGVRYYRKHIYVTGVCSGESNPNPKDTAGLRAIVTRFTPEDSSFKVVLDFPLTFTRGSADKTGNCAANNRWYSWSSVFPAACDPSGTFVMHAQPIFSDIEFDTDSSLVLGFMDRFGHQGGRANFSPNKNDMTLYTAFMGGDLLRASYVSDEKYEIEKNAVAGKRTGDGPNNGQGPSNGEFYAKDDWIFNGSVAHDEVLNGSLAMIAGYDDVYSSAFDPLDSVYQSNGWRTFSNKDGKLKSRFAVYDFNYLAGFGKAGGLGDIKFSCGRTPVEIGNLVWYDKNRNGIQDADEKGINDIVIQLFDVAANKVVATDTTKNDGQYYFNDTNVEGKLKPKHTYEVRMNFGQISVKGPYPGEPVPALLPLTKSANPVRQAANGRVAAVAADTTIAQQYQLSPGNASNFQDPDLRDSNAGFNADSSEVVITITTGDLGQNDHTQDIGLMRRAAPEEKIDLQLSKKLVGDCIRNYGDTVQFQIVVTNQEFAGGTTADSVFVSDTLSGNFTFKSAIASQGAYNALTHLWGPLSLEPGRSDTLTITALVAKTENSDGGTFCNTAQVHATIQEDIDSAPANNVITEDDLGRACVSVPIKICKERKDTLELSAPGVYQTYQWYKGGVKIEGATNATLEVGDAGEYSVQVNGTNCPNQSCCPIKVIEDCECPEDICVPFVTKRIRPAVPQGAALVPPSGK